MTFNGSLAVFMEDTVTIEPFVSMTGAQVPTYGAAVTYSAQIQVGTRRMTGKDGKEIDSNVQVTIPERVFVDPRSRITLPTGFVPQTPPIMAVQHLKFQDLDHTMVAC